MDYKIKKLSYSKGGYKYIIEDIRDKEEILCKTLREAKIKIKKMKGGEIQ